MALLRGRTRGALRAAAVAALAVAPAGCDFLDGTGVGTIAERELRINRWRWESADVSSYRFVLQVECACTAGQQRPVEVEVRGGAAVSVTDYQTGAPADAAFFGRFDTVEEMFEVIEDALAQDADVAVLYESRYALGHPESVLIDYSEFRSGDELSFVVLTELEILD